MRPNAYLVMVMPAVIGLVVGIGVAAAGGRRQWVVALVTTFVVAWWLPLISMRIRSVHAGKQDRKNSS